MLSLILTDKSRYVCKLKVYGRDETLDCANWIKTHQCLCTRVYIFPNLEPDGDNDENHYDDHDDHDHDDDGDHDS